MHITNYTDEGLTTKVDPDQKDGQFPSIIFTVSKTDDYIRQFCTWDQLETLRDQINEALGARANAKHLDNCEKDNDRCAVCGWPLKEKVEDGCIRGNCSQRPRPERLYDEPRAIMEARRDADESELKQRQQTEIANIGGRVFKNGRYASIEEGGV